MGLVDVVLLGLCFNCTRNVTELDDIATEKRLQLSALASDLKGKHFTVATVQNPPLSYAEEENGVLIGKGIAFEFLSFLQEKYEFNYTVVLPVETENSNASGIFGMLDTEQADIGAAFLPVLPKFWNFVHYSRSLDIGQWVVLMKRPPESATSSGLLAPFTLYVWLLILLSLTAVGPIIYLMIKLHIKFCPIDEQDMFSLPACIWFVYGALLKQGSTLSPLTDTSRLMFATWWIFITILTAFYTANLTAFLTLSRFTLPINKPEDIGGKKCSWVSHKGSAISDAVQPGEELYVPFQGSTSRLVDESSTGVLENWVNRHDLMYIGERPIVEHLMYNDYRMQSDPNIEEKNRCRYVITSWTILTRPRAFAFSKAFPYYELFDTILEHVVEAGIVKYKMSEGLPNTQICPLDLGSKERQLRNSDLYMTYIIVAAGFVISATIFISELIFNYFFYAKIEENVQFNDNLHVHETKHKDKLFALNKLIMKEHLKKNNNKRNKDDDKSVDAPPPPPPPPSYHALFRPPFAFSPNGTKKLINGREYWVVKTHEGETRLVPVRSPSAFLYSYTN